MSDTLPLLFDNSFYRIYHVELDIARSVSCLFLIALPQTLLFTVAYHPPYLSRIGHTFISLHASSAYILYTCTIVDRPILTRTLIHSTYDESPFDASHPPNHFDHLFP